jgi:SAM-dependent methyltransferase
MSNDQLNLSYMTTTMQKVSCPICEKTESTIISSGKSRGKIDLTYVICHSCTHIYMKYVPSKEAYTKFYTLGDYRRLTGDNQKLRDSKNFALKSSQGARLYYEYLQGKILKEDIIFDFGCGDGAWLAGLQNTVDCHVTGNEPSQEDADFIKKNLGIDIYVGLIEDCYENILSDLKGKVKLAIISGSLQHMLDPMKCLRLANQILRDDGYLYVCNKNIFVHYISKKSPYPRFFLDLRTADHPHYFHENSYKNMIQSAGFEILSFSNDSKVRKVHMEIFAQKNMLKSYEYQNCEYTKIIDELITKENEVKKFRSPSARFQRWLNRKLTILKAKGSR